MLHHAKSRVIALGADDPSTDPALCKQLAQAICAAIPEREQLGALNMALDTLDRAKLTAALSFVFPLADDDGEYGIATRTIAGILGRLRAEGRMMSGVEVAMWSTAWSPITMRVVLDEAQSCGYTPSAATMTNVWQEYLFSPFVQDCGQFIDVLLERDWLPPSDFMKKALGLSAKLSRAANPEVAAARVRAVLRMQSALLGMNKVDAPARASIRGL